MKRTILLTMLVLSLTLGASGVHATTCPSGGNRNSPRAFWQQVMLVLSSLSPLSRHAPTPSCYGCTGDVGPVIALTR